jgi:hypothetical protein
MLVRVEECGSTYLPQVNAFYVREFQMMHAAEDATRFLHQACQGLPHRWNGHCAQEPELSNEQRAADRFYTHVIEHAIAYFGSRVLYPSRPAAVTDNAPLTRAGMHKIAQAATRSAENIERAALELGHHLGSQIYDAYLAGKLAPSGLRRLFLAHLDEPGLARKVCGAVLSKLKSASRPLAGAAHA